MKSHKYTADNLMLMRKYFNNLYHLVRNQERDQINYLLMLTRSELPGLEIKKEDVSSLMYSKYDPMREAEAWVEKLAEAVDNVQHIFVYGFGLGYHVERLIAKYPDKYIHILEPNLEIMLAAIEARDLSAILKHKNIGIFAIGNDQLTNTLFVNQLTSYLSKSFHAAFMPYYIKYYSEEVSSISSMLRAAVVSNRTNYATQLFFKHEWPENILMNIEKIINTRPITLLKSKLKEFPAIVVGSGPSLDEDIEYLRKYQNKAIIIAAGTSIQALLNHGIKPHIVVSMDGSDKNYEAFKDLDLTGITFVFAAYLKHKIFEHLTSLEDVYHCFIDTDSITKYLLDVKDKSLLFHSTASVTGTVIQLAAYLGVKNILFTGQDLSYPGNIVYASQVDHFSESENQRTIDRAKEEVINVAGGKNPTTKVMRNTLENIESLIMIYGKQIEFINTSRTGARIKGTKEIPFSQVEDIVAFCDLTPEQLRARIKRDTAPYSAYEKERIFSRLENTYSELKLLKENDLKDALQELDVLKKKLEQKNEKAVENCLIQLNKLWQKIVESFTFAPVFGMVVQSHITIYKRFLPEILREQNIIKRGELVLEHLGALLVAIHKQTPQILDLMDRVLKKIK